MLKTGTIRLPADDFSSGTPATWALDTGTGERTYLSPDLPYAPPWSGAGQPFSSPPTVIVSLAGMDVTGGLPNVRLSVENVQVEEFNIRVTATGTTLTEVWVTWMAHDGA